MTSTTESYRIRQANHNHYLWSEGTKTMWLCCTWATNLFHLQYEKDAFPEIWNVIERVNGISTSGDKGN